MTNANPTRLLKEAAQLLALVGSMAAVWWLFSAQPGIGLLGSWAFCFMIWLYYTGHLKER